MIKRYNFLPFNTSKSMNILEFGRHQTIDYLKVEHPEGEYINFNDISKELKELEELSMKIEDNIKHGKENGDYMLQQGFTLGIQACIDKLK